MACFVTRIGNAKERTDEGHCGHRQNSFSVHGFEIVRSGRCVFVVAVPVTDNDAGHRHRSECENMFRGHELGLLPRIHSVKTKCYE